MEHLLQAYCAMQPGRESQQMNNILLAVHAEKTPVRELVEQLGDYLTSTDQLVRSRGTRVLSELLLRLPEWHLDSRDVHFLCSFFAVRLQDYGCVEEVLTGLCALLEHHRLSTHAQVDSVVRALFDNVHVQSQPQRVRQKVFALLHVLACSSNDDVGRFYLDAMRSMKSDFAFGLIQSIDGERDPRCLMLAFDLIETCVARVPGTLRFVDDIFQVTSVYFPVSFKPRDGETITAEQLAGKLERCLLAHPALGRLAVPFLLEQFADDGEHEALNVLVRCAQRFGHRALAPHFDALWATFREHCFGTSTGDAAAIDSVLSALTDIVAALVDDIDDDIDDDDDEALRLKPMHTFVDLVLDDCARHLNDAYDDGDVVAAVASQLMVAACKASPLSFRRVLDGTLPAFAEQRYGIEHLVPLLRVGAKPARRPRYGAVLGRRDADALATLVVDTLDYAPLGTCMSTLGAVAAMRALDDAQLRALLAKLADVALAAAHASDSERLQAITLLVQLASVAPAVVAADVLPRLFDAHDRHADDDDDASLVRFALLALGSLAGADDSLLDVVAERLLASPRRTDAQADAVRRALEASSAAAVDRLLQRDEMRAALLRRADDVALDIALRQCAPPQQAALLGDAIAADASSGGRASLLVAAKPAALVALFDARADDVRALLASDSDVRTIASVLNKLPVDSPHFGELLAEALDRLDDDAPSLDAHAWLAKALCMRVHQPLGSELAARLVHIAATASNAERSLDAARALLVVLDATLSPLDIAHHANIGAFYRQRLFVEMQPALAASPLPGAALAIVGALDHVPKPVVDAHLSDVLPVALRALADPTGAPALVDRALAFARHRLLVEHTPLFVGHVSSIVERLLAIAAERQCNVRTRANAIYIVAIAPDHVDYDQLYPLRKRIVSALQPLLADRKRLVRRAAAQCRNRFMMWK
jgi:Dos2-interacting transcription regulator of RNA-Pol-II/RNAPII transcription regulator C-terminal